MKTYSSIILCLAAAMIALAGCAKKDTVNTAPLEQSFKSAEPATQSSVDKTVAAIKAGDFASAGVELKTLAQNAKLTPEQQQAVKDVMGQVEKVITDGAAKVSAEAGKALDNVKQSLPK